MPESYSVGEKVFLRYRVESLRGEDFTLGSSGDVAPWFVLSLNGEKLTTKGTVTVTGTDQHELQLTFQPTKVGQHALDVWYYVKASDSQEYECRTVRFILSVVR